ncbi:MAG: filamentous hemagglutinin N-terminal domain-containing protein [Chlamydiales bacterium]|nr:filamentous hemagglutinin N-terminal domain-containing protein [Chlamydiales bacterium]
MRVVYLFLIFSFTLLANPTGLEVIKGSASSRGGNTLTVTASDGSVLHWNSFSIGEGEKTIFVQPNESSWVLNRVTGTTPSEILGTLQANGQLLLLNSQGILFGAGSTVDVGGLIASTLGEGPIVHRGAIHARSGDVILMGKTVECFGSIDILGPAAIHGEDNPYALAIQYKRPKEAQHLQEVNGRILLLSEKETFVPPGGSLIAKEIALISKGVTTFQGYGKVDEGVFEISGKKYFYHAGEIERTGGHLILDPEADVTISTAPPYNYSYEAGMAEADFANLSITQLIGEIEKGPVTITTAFQGEGGNLGSIRLMSDVSHTYNSPYPLIFNCSGTGGIHIDGILKNLGTGSIALVGETINVQGELEGHQIDTHGVLTCSGNLYGHTLHLQSENGATITGKVIADGGPLTWLGGNTLRLQGGEIGNTGYESLLLQGFENITLEQTSRIHTFHSNLTISDLSGTLSIEDSVIRGSGPVSLSGGMCSLHLNHGTLESTNQLNINLGRYLHCHDSVITSQQPLSLTIGHDLVLTGNALMTSTSGISLNGQGNLFLADDAVVRGPGLSLIVGESTFLYSGSRIDGEQGTLTLTTGENLFLEGKGARITGGHLSIHAGQTATLENQSAISSTYGTLSLTAALGLHLFDQATLSATGGNLELYVPNGNLSLSGHSALRSTTDGAQLFIGQSLILDHFSQVESVGEKGTVIVVDQMNQGGGFVLGQNASITTGYSSLQIFTAAPRYNSIEGTLNGHRYTTDMPLYLTTSQDHWGTAYPDLFVAEPFTIFHKENGLIETNIGPINEKTYLRHIVEYIGPFTAELFRDLHPYDAYTKESITFTDNEEPYFIRRRARQ